MGHDGIGPWPDGFEDVWQEWVNYRVKLKGVKDWPVMFRKQLKMLWEHKESAVQILENSMANGWKGLFPEKIHGPTGAQQAGTNGKKPPSTWELTQALEIAKRERKEIYDQYYNPDGFGRWDDPVHHDRHKALSRKISDLEHRIKEAVS